MSSSTFRQDMPPKGGYDPVQWARKAGRQTLPGWKFWLGLGVTTAVGWAHYRYLDHRYRMEAIETNDGRLALTPFLNAEFERNTLRQLKKNRDDENELMKNVPGWITGTYYGEPVYHNQSNRYPLITPEDIYAHTQTKHMTSRFREKMRH